MTETQIVQLEVGKILYDDKVTGLHVRALKTKKVFYYVYRNAHGTQRRPKIGNCGALSIKQAREIAQHWAFEIILGNDPSIDKRALRAAQTVREAFKHCAQTHWSQARYTRSGWAKEVKRLYESKIDPVFGHEKLNDVTSAAIKKWHHTFESTPIEGNRALSTFKTIFKLSDVPWPASSIKPHQEKSRGRYATKEELTKILRALKAHQADNPRGAAFIEVCILTGARPSSLSSAGLTNGSYLFVSGKTGEDKIYLPKRARELIFQTNCLGIKAPTVLWNKIRTEAGCPDLWLRDLRRTFATLGFSMGNDMSLISELLNHKSTQTTKIYAKLLNDKREEVAEQVASQVAALACQP